MTKEDLELLNGMSLIVMAMLARQPGRCFRISGEELAKIADANLEVTAFEQGEEHIFALIDRSVKEMMN